MPPMSFPMMNNPMLAAMTGGMALNPLLMNPNSAALALASASVASGHTSPAAALASLAAATQVCIYFLPNHLKDMQNKHYSMRID